MKNGSNPLPYDCLDSLLESLRIELLALSEILWLTKDLLTHSNVDSDIFSNSYTKSPEHKDDNAANLSDQVLYSFDDKRG